MSVAFSSDALDARFVGGLQGFMDAGAANCRIRLYGNTQPAAGATPGAAPLVEIELAKPSGAMVAGAYVLARENSDGDLILNEGDAVWGRMVNGNDEWVCDGEVTDEAGDGVFKVSGTTGTHLYAGARAVLATSFFA